MIFAILVLGLLVVGAYFFGKAIGSGAFGAARAFQDFLEYLERK